MASPWCGTVYTADSAERLSSASWERTVDTGHSDDRDKERRKAGRKVVVAIKKREIMHVSTCVCVFQLTAFVYIRRDVDGGGVVRDESFEVGVYLEIIWKISVVLPWLCLIKLHKRDKTTEPGVLKVSCKVFFGLKGQFSPKCFHVVALSYG